MDIDRPNSIFQIPSFARRETYNFEPAPQEPNEIYQELNQIAEELEKCRLGNS